MTNLSDLIHRYRYTALYIAYVLYVAGVFQTVSLLR